MIEPSDILAKPPPTYARGDLLSSEGVYGMTEGILSPVIVLDRKAESEDGFEGLVWHESVHAYECHALTRLTFLGLALLGFASSLALHALWPALFGAGMLCMWCWWWREQEVRADALALFAVGHRMFNAFLYMHHHPSGFKGRYMYGQSRVERHTRALERCSAYGWIVEP